MKENNGERAIKGFLRAYMAERKLHKAVAYLDKNIQWIGTGAAEHSCTYQETVAALQEELLTEPWPYDYQFQAFQATQVDEKNQLLQSLHLEVAEMNETLIERERFKFCVNRKN